MSSPSAERVRRDQAPYGRHVLDHRGLVAGMCDALGRGDVIDDATPQHPAMRDLPVGAAVNALGLTGGGCLNQARSRGPSGFQHQPTDRLSSPRLVPAPRHADARGRALESRSASGVTARDRLMAATAAARLGRTPRLAHLERTRVPGDGRDNSDDASADQVVPITRGSRRDPRPDGTHVRWELRVAHPAGMPRWRKPRRGNRRAAQEVGAAGRAPGPQ
jgi:hypothetical protein